jgi:alpha-glucosidase
MQDHAWWRGATIYQIYPRSFADSNHDGIGDLPGITARLDHVARLGVDAIWLSPVFLSPQRDFGYDVSDHTAIDPLFGTLHDFDALVERAHGLGLRVLIDQVWSHTSTQHAWFRASRAGRTGPMSDWYVWADAQPDGTPPNNWLSVFGGSAWTWEPRRRQFYLHHFLPDQPQLNLHDPAVQDALLDTGRFWLDRGVDGFRLDAVDFFAHDPRLRANAPAPSDSGAKLFGRQVHEHDMLHPARFDFLRRIRALTDQHPGAVTLGEVSSQDGAFDRCREYTAGTRHLHMAYTLKPLRQGFSHAAMQALVEESARDAGWLCWSFSNHDVERAVSRWNPTPGQAPDPRFARMLLEFQLSLRGSVCLYQGEELGLEEAALDEADLRDPFGIAYWPEFRGRDGSRTPMPWIAGAQHGGFSTEKPWLPVADSHRGRAVDVMEADEASLLHDWRRFLRHRARHTALRHGDLRNLRLPAPLIGFTRGDAQERILCLFNFSGETAMLHGLRFLGAGLPDALPPYGTAFAATAMQALPDMAYAAD